MLSKWIHLNQKGQGMVEYAIVIALLAVALVAIFPFLRTALEGGMTAIGGNIRTILTGAGT